MEGIPKEEKIKFLNNDGDVAISFKVFGDEILINESGSFTITALTKQEARELAIFLAKFYENWQL